MKLDTSNLDPELSRHVTFKFVVWSELYDEQLVLGNIHKRRRLKGRGKGGGHKADEKRWKLEPSFGKNDIVFYPSKNVLKADREC